MMELDEGKGLLDINLRQSKESIVDNCINNPKTWKIALIALTLAMGNAADAVEIMCVGFIMSEISDLSSLDKELLSSAVFIGMLVGGIAGGYLSDIFGRKRTLLYCLSLNAIAGLISGASPTVNFLIVCRVLAGLGIGGSVPIVFSTGAELFPASSRGYYLSVIASFWMVGAIFVAFSAWIMLGDDFSGAKILPGVDWRWFAVVSALPAIVALTLTYNYLVESPRYLMNLRRYEDVVKVLQEISTVHVKVNDFVPPPCPPVTSGSANTTSSSISGNEVASPRKVEQLADDSLPVSNLTVIETLQLLFGEQFLRSTVVLMTIWFTLSFGSYGISTWISILFSDVGIGNPYAASFIFALANLPGNLISLAYIDKIGRRWLLSVGMFLAGISSIGFALDSKDSFVVVLFASLFNAFSVMGWNSLDCLSAEVFPTIARSTAMGLLAASGRLGAVSGQFINGVLEKNIPLLLFVTSACSILGGVVAWALPKDTAGSSLGEEVDRRVSVERTSSASRTPSRDVMSLGVASNGNQVKSRSNYSSNPLHQDDLEA